ncbi:MAG: hypothetical protein QOI20_655, partial [Acidimicrobiaceae bacterium]|jgi:hypothetical protein|nr:hypothetical protein [Acidimicrobiaceae bacterium]
LRSHAEILRRLHDLGVNLDDDTASPAHAGSTHGPVRVGPPSPRTQGQAAPAIVGVTPFDEAVTIAPASGGRDTVLAFLTTGCTSCRPFWDAVRDPATGNGGRRMVVVTRGPGDESVSAARALTQDGMDVVMSSDAWADYAVPGAPYFVHVSGATGRVSGEGTAQTLAQVLELLTAAEGDAQVPGPWSSDAEREAHVDRELEAAGIHPGDPRLYHEPPRA